MKIYIARDGNGELFFYAGKPRLTKGKKIWQPSAIQDGGYTIGVRMYQKLNKTLFPEVTFENSPQEVELVIKK